MTGEDDGWTGWRVVPRVVAGAAAVPLVVGFVALGAAVIIGRSVRDVLRVGLARPFGRGGRPGEPPVSDPPADVPPRERARAARG